MVKGFVLTYGFTSAASHLCNNMALPAPEVDSFLASLSFSYQGEKALLRSHSWSDVFSLLTHQHYVLLGLASSMASMPLEEVFAPPLHRRFATLEWVHNCKRAAHMSWSSSKLCDKRHHGSRHSLMCQSAHPNQQTPTNNLSKGFRAEANERYMPFKNAS